MVFSSFSDIGVNRGEFRDGIFVPLWGRPCTGGSVFTMDLIFSVDCVGARIILYCGVGYYAPSCDMFLGAWGECFLD